MNIVLVVAAHPDDEVLGCGGTIANHVANGDQVHAVIMSSGVRSRDTGDDVQKKIASLKEEAYEAHEILGTTSLKLLDFPDNRFDSLSILDVAKAIEIELSIYKPDIVYTHHLGDLNIDHQITHKAVLTACRPFPEQSVKTIISFEVPSSTEWQSSVDTNVFVPNCFKSISTTIEKKLQSLAAYSSEMREWPHARSIIAVEHLASWRGASAGLDVAEAFIVIRDIHS